MAEEEQIDVLGDGFQDYYSKRDADISNISSGQILSLEYTLHERWLNDVESSDLLPANLPTQSSQDEIEMVKDEVVIEEPAPIDFNWYEEVSNDDIIMEEDIPATLEEEVVTNSDGDETECDEQKKHIINSNHININSGGKYHQISNNIVITKDSSSSSSSSTLNNRFYITKTVPIPVNPRSLLKRNYIFNRFGNHQPQTPVIKFRQTLLINRRILRTSQENRLTFKPNINMVNNLNIISDNKDIQSITIPSNIISSSSSTLTTSKSLTTPSYSAKSATILNKPHKVIQLKHTKLKSHSNLSNKNINNTSCTSTATTSNESTEDGSPCQSHMMNPSVKKFRYSGGKAGPCGTTSYSSLQQNTNKTNSKQNIQSKFKQTINLSKNNYYNKPRRQLATFSRVNKSKHGYPNNRVRGHNKTSGKSKRRRKFIDTHGCNITTNHDNEVVFNIQDNKEEMIKINRNDSESDIEVDILTSDSPPHQILNQTTDTDEASMENFNDNITNENKTVENTLLNSPPITSLMSSKNKPPLIGPDLKNYSPELLKLLNDDREPDTELKMSHTEITELEKYFNYEFFEGRQVKTPDRYISIRNFILDKWYEIKPNYLTKTSLRTGLKYCGDVTCISRIHTLLEQIGAINFDHNNEYFSYVRPLSKLATSVFQNTNRYRKLIYTKNTINLNVNERKPRNRNHMTNDDNNVDSSFASSNPSVRNCRNDNINSSLNSSHLIQCKYFTDANCNYSAPFTVSITLSSLLCLQLHSLSSPYEVMGFLGGHESTSNNNNNSKCKSINLTRYKPCQTSEQSGVMCEMCPISQVEQSINLRSEGYEIFGWFHSHPTFPPNPSRTDVQTQAKMQIQFSKETNQPFIGFILSCIDNRFKCIHIMPEDLYLTEDSNFTNHIIPYEFNVQVIKNCSNLKTELRDVLTVMDTTDMIRHQLVLQKFSTTANTLLQQYGVENDILAYITT